ncbi:flagellar hook-associated protein 2 [Paenibacillus turicensis]|uniref:Flagellar hook-associated protein 2 n=1 Tax=Paenibacillus turicensis TaxID=160487 RepID=A0ABS4FXE7_9BACL|nr:flagellar filament capping protein FliD [Paenibacillus turicensis]MBP1907227.1 flagellar hook-associated protein 2 [Paenibacillus turicensis]
MRVSGLASGMDIDAMVTKLMSARRTPLNKLNQDKQILEWRRDNYKQINSGLVDFRQNKLFNYRSTSAMSIYSSEVTGDKDAISVKAQTSANMVPMEVKVISVAEPTTVKSEKLATGVSTSSTLSSLQASGSEPSEYYIQTPGKKITFSGSDTIKNVLDKLNGDKEANVSAVFDEASRQIIIKSKSYDGSVEIKGNLTAKMETDASLTSPGKAAEVEINGEKFKPAGNMLTVNGVEITLLQKSADNATSTISTRADGKKAIETIKSFIEDYNSLIKTMNSKISEKRYKNFAPLSADQKKEMKEDDIKLWTEKAQSGLLRGDTIISEGLSNMRNILIESSVRLGDKTISLPDLGITTGTYTENGKLYLNEDKLKQAISDHPDKVMELFIGSSDGNTKGIFDKLYDTTLNTLGRISDKSGTSKYSSDLTQTLDEQSTMGKELTDLDDRIKALTKRLTSMEESYYTKFNAMEQAINKLNSQTSSITNLLSN